MEASQVFFEGWPGIGRTLLVGSLAYILLLLTLRISGKRTIARMNIYDFIVSVAIGSTLATSLLSRGVVLAEALTAFVVLAGMQFLVSIAEIRSHRVAKLINGEPALLVHRGELLHSTMLGERITEQEVMAAIRSKGFSQLHEVEALVLETDGTFSAIQRPAAGPSSALTGVPGYEEESRRKSTGSG
jgi:uncharacterized membrane protein YcaP (DUF421 family)